MACVVKSGTIAEKPEAAKQARKKLTGHAILASLVQRAQE